MRGWGVTSVGKTWRKCKPKDIGLLLCSLCLYMSQQNYLFIILVLDTECCWKFNQCKTFKSKMLETNA